MWAKLLFEGGRWLKKHKQILFLFIFGLFCPISFEFCQKMTLYIEGPLFLRQFIIEKL